MKIKVIEIEQDYELDIIPAVNVHLLGFYLGSSDQWTAKNEIITNDVLSTAESNTLTNITGKTFYRCSKLALPRDKMNIINKKHNTKVVRDIKTADHIIISEKYINSLTDNIWDKMYEAEDILSLVQTIKSDVLTDALFDELNEAINSENKVYYMMKRSNYSYYNNRKSGVLTKFVSALDKLKGSRGYHTFIECKVKNEWDYLQLNKSKLIMDNALSAIATADSLIINKDIFNQLCNMFRSEDRENHTLGMEMIANCNVEESKGFIALLFFRFCEEKFKRAKSWNHVNFKTVRQRFERFNLTWSRHSVAPYDRFITELVTKEKGLTTFVMESILDTVYESVIEASFGINSNSVFIFNKADLKLKKEYADKCTDKNIGQVLLGETIDDLPF